MDVKPMNLKSTDAVQHFSNANQQVSGIQQNPQNTVSTPARILGDSVSSESAQILKEVLQISDVLNRKVKFSVDTDSNRVIVRIVDKETNEVIKELPPEALVKLHKKMKEAMGILGVFVDQKA